MCNDEDFMAVLAFKNQGIAKLGFFKDKLSGKVADDVVIKRCKKRNAFQGFRSERGGASMKINADSLWFLQFNFCAVDAVGTG